MAEDQTKQRDVVAEAALAALEAEGGDQTRAAKLLEGRVSKDKALRSALLDPLITYACHQAIGVQIRAHRDRVWNPRTTAPPASASHQDRVLALAAGNLLMFPLPGGRMLGEATREEVLAGATFYATHAKDMAHKARWLKLVHDGMGNQPTVSAAYDETQLAQLKSEAA